MQHQEETWC